MIGSLISLLTNRSSGPTPAAAPDNPNLGEAAPNSPAGGEPGGFFAMVMQFFSSQTLNQQPQPLPSGGQVDPVRNEESSINTPTSGTLPLPFIPEPSTPGMTGSHWGTTMPVPELPDMPAAALPVPARWSSGNVREMESNAVFPGAAAEESMLDLPAFAKTSEVFQASDSLKSQRQHAKETQTFPQGFETPTPGSDVVDGASQVREPARQRKSVTGSEVHPRGKNASPPTQPSSNSTASSATGTSLFGRLKEMVERMGGTIVDFRTSQATKGSTTSQRVASGTATPAQNSSTPAGVQSVTGEATRPGARRPEAPAGRAPAVAPAVDNAAGRSDKWITPPGNPERDSKPPIADSARTSEPTGSNAGRGNRGGADSNQRAIEVGANAPRPGSDLSPATEPAVRAAIDQPSPSQTVEDGSSRGAPVQASRNTESVEVGIGNINNPIHTAGETRAAGTEENPEARFVAVRGTESPQAQPATSSLGEIHQEAPSPVDKSGAKVTRNAESESRSNYDSHEVGQGAPVALHNSIAERAKPPAEPASDQPEVTPAERYAQVTVDGSPAGSKEEPPPAITPEAIHAPVSDPKESAGATMLTRESGQYRSTAAPSTNGEPVPLSGRLSRSPEQNDAGEPRSNGTNRAAVLNEGVPPARRFPVDEDTGTGGSKPADQHDVADEGSEPASKQKAEEVKTFLTQNALERSGVKEEDSPITSTTDEQTVADKTSNSPKTRAAGVVPLREGVVTAAPISSREDQLRTLHEGAGLEESAPERKGGQSPEAVRAPEVRESRTGGEIGAERLASQRPASSEYRAANSEVKEREIGPSSTLRSGARQGDSSVPSQGATQPLVSSSLRRAKSQAQQDAPSSEESAVTPQHEARADKSTSTLEPQSFPVSKPGPTRSSGEASLSERKQSEEGDKSGVKSAETENQMRTGADAEGSRTSSQTEAAQTKTAEPRSPEIPARAQHASGELRQAGQPMTSEASHRHEMSPENSMSRMVLPPEFSDRLASRIGDALRMNFEGSISEMRIRLQPESLGSLTFRIEVDEGRMNAAIQVSQPETKAAVEANLPHLKQALANQGIDVHRIDVYVAAESQMKDNAQQRQTLVRQRSRRRGAVETTSVEAVDKYESGKRMGYSTIELIM